jgi:phosphate transport system substrate-binding protein
MNSKLPALAMVLLIGLSGCSGGGGSSGPPIKLTGAGASFPMPIYTRWFQDYHKQHGNVNIDYQSVGSGAGVKSVIDGTVDFGASDGAMSPEEIAKVPRGIQLLPMTAGSIVLCYNVPEVKELKLSREAYVNIFLGKITKWNDPELVKCNAGAALPDKTINVIVRADSSGTSQVFTKHLSAISKDFAASPGENKMPNWPVGTKSKGSEGVTASLKTTPGSIGYVEYGYAMGAKIPMAALENKDGNYVAPTTAAGQAALASTTMPDDLVAWLPDPAGKDAYPIVTYTWLLCYKKYDDKKKLETLKDVLGYALTDGQKVSEQLGYIPLPANVVDKVKAALNNMTFEEKKTAGQAGSQRVLAVLPN